MVVNFNEKRHKIVLFLCVSGIENLTLIFNIIPLLFKIIVLLIIFFACAASTAFVGYDTQVTACME